MLSRLILLAVSLASHAPVTIGIPCNGIIEQNGQPHASQLPLKQAAPVRTMATTNLEVNWDFFCHDGKCRGGIAFSVNDGTNTRKPLALPLL